MPKAKKQGQIEQPLKKVEPAVRGQHFEDLEEVMRSSASSFYSTHSKMSPEQASRIKSKPFMIKARAEEDEYEEIESMRASATKLLKDGDKDEAMEDLENYLAEVKSKCGIEDEQIDERVKELDSSMVSEISVSS